MSTEIFRIGGKQEVPDYERRESNYKSAELWGTRFWGGNERGTCLQITIPGSHIQLEAGQVAALVEKLKEWETLPEIDS